MDKLNGYIVVELGGEPRPIKFGMGALALIAEERGKPIQQIFDGLNEFSFVGWITYGGIKFACLSGYSELKPPANVYVVMDWLNKAEPENFAAIGKCFAESRSVGETMKSYMDKIEDAPENNKKKATSRKF